MPAERIDDKYAHGVWFDGTTGSFYELNRINDGERDRIKLKDALNDDIVEVLDAAEFLDRQHDFYPVPDNALNDPVEYLDKYLTQLKRSERALDVGKIWARRVTEIVETDAPN